tara:strand:+ start:1868 stop:2332 length:465 start_codon:yes stop_codon:yes gene_type:complete
MEEITTRSGEVFEVTTEALTPFKATGKTVNEIVADWENTPMTKAEIVKHFVEICKMDEEALARETEETKKWQRDVLELQKQNQLVWEIVEKRDKEISDVEKQLSNLVQASKNLQYIEQEKDKEINKAKRILNICEEYKLIDKYWLDALKDSLGA